MTETISNVDVCVICKKLRHEHPRHTLCVCPNPNCIGGRIRQTNGGCCICEQPFTPVSQQELDGERAASDAGYGSGSLASVIQNLTTLCAHAVQRARDADTELTALREEVERLKGALYRYGSHLLTCEQVAYDGDAPCTCGLAAALSPSPAQQEPESA